MLSGTADTGELAATAPEVGSPAEAPWELGQATVVTATVELAGARQELFPAALHPTVPVLARIEAVDVPGLVRWARLGLSCRSGMRPRQYVTGGFACGDPAAIDRLRRGWAWPAGAGEVTVSVGYDATRVTVVSAGEPVLELTASDPHPLNPGDVQWFSALHRARLDRGPRLVQVDVGAEINRAERSALRIDGFVARAWGDERITLSHPLAATVVHASLGLGPVRFLNRLDVWAFDGTERLA